MVKTSAAKDASPSPRRYRREAVAWSAAFLVLLAGVLSRPGFRLFGENIHGEMLIAHLLVEFFSICVCVLVVAVAWHGTEREHFLPASVLIYGLTVVGGLDLVHALSYEGMPPLLGSTSTSLAIVYWFAGRGAETLVLAAVALQFKLPLRRGAALLAGLLSVCAFAALARPLLQHLPPLFVSGSGVTRVKSAVDYVLSAAHLGVALLLWRQASRTTQPWLFLLSAAAFIGGIGEVLFTSYVEPSDFSNFAGHFFKVAAYTLIYRGLYLTALRAPYLRLAQAQDALTRQQSVLRSMVNSIPFEIWVRDADSRLIVENPTLIARWGSQMGKTLSDMPIAPELLALWQARTAHVLAGGTSSETVDQDVGGQSRHFHSIIAPVREQDRIIGVVGVNIDLTEQRRAERALIASEARLRLLLRHSPIAIAMLDREERYIYISDRWRTSFGLEEAEVIGRRHEDVFPREPETWRQLRRATLAGEAQRGEASEVALPNGRRAWLDWEMQPWYAADHSLGGILLFTQIVSDRVRAQQEVTRLNTDLERRVLQRTEELRRVNAELEEFAASVSHDLQAPLRSIGGYADLLREELADLPGEALRFLNAISADTARAQRLITDLLRLARIGRVPLQRATVDLNAMIAEVIKGLASQLQGREVQWHIAPLPQVQVDPSLFHQVLENLIGNAVKFTAARSPAVIEIGCADDTADPQETVVFIRDNGAGFDMRHAQRLFGAFQRLHSEREFPGSGVGLANVKRIIERHAGRVWAQAQAGRGACFYIGLPLLPAPTQPDAG